jgi:hypothetical protein
MAVSHSFAGEHVEDGGDEKTDADCDHHEIEHLTYLSVCFADPGTFSLRAFAVNAQPGDFEAD